MAAANLVPFSVAPNLEGEDKEELRKQYEEQIDSKTIQDTGEQKDEHPGNLELEPLSPEKEKILFEKIDLYGIKVWDPEDQTQVRVIQRIWTIICIG